MITLNPTGTLIRAALLSLGDGVLWALLAAWLIYVGSALTPPRLRVGEIWARWREKRRWWIGGLLLTALACGATEEWLLRSVGLKDLYWLTRSGDMMLICRTGAASGYLLVLALFTLGALILRQAGTRRKAGGPARRQTPGSNNPPGGGPNPA